MSLNREKETVEYPTAPVPRPLTGLRIDAQGTGSNTDRRPDQKNRWNAMPRTIRNAQALAIALALTASFALAQEPPDPPTQTTVFEVAPAAGPGVPVGGVPPQA